MRVPLRVPPSREAPNRLSAGRRRGGSRCRFAELDHSAHATPERVAAPFVAADVAGGFVARAALPPTISDLSNVRAAVADAKALVDKGDLAAARTRLKDLDKFWDGAVASSSPQTVARWRVIDRAIDRGLDRALLGARPDSVWTG